MPFGSEPREEGIALALSGGGYRAVMFHVGSIIRLNESGILSQLKRVSSVSGGSIAAGVLAVHWSKLVPDNKGRFNNLDKEFVQPLRAFCGKTLDVWSVISGALNPFKTAGDEVIESYRDDLGLGVKLRDLPNDGPRFVFNSTNFATGSSFRFSKPYCGDYRIGLIRDFNNDFDVAFAVGCSSAFPPVLSPIEVDVDPKLFEKTEGADLYDRIDFRKKLQLADGGVYDNLGLETIWGRYETVLASDAGKPFELNASQNGFSPQLFRVMNIGLNQALALRKRTLIDNFKASDGAGAYWGIATDIRKYNLQDVLPVSQSKIEYLSQIRTRLDKFNEQEQCELINWGYAVTDAAIRAKQPALNVPPGLRTFPCKNFPLNP